MKHLVTEKIRTRLADVNVYMSCCICHQSDQSLNNDDDS